jgi:hypothetical protein
MHDKIEFLFVIEKKKKLKIRNFKLRLFFKNLLSYFIYAFKQVKNMILL